MGDRFVFDVAPSHRGVALLRGLGFFIFVGGFLACSSHNSHDGFGESLSR
jgi:hypothetical protein